MSNSIILYDIQFPFLYSAQKKKKKRKRERSKEKRIRQVPEDRNGVVTKGQR